MPYQIFKSDGSPLTTLLDEVVDTESTSVTLIGKNFSEYGQYYNNTLVALVENFASSQQPNNPLVGQLWYDKATGLLNIFTQRNEFESIIPNISSPNEPPNSKTGDLWIDTTTGQLKFKSDDDRGFIVAGPIYTAEQGLCGFHVVTVRDNTDFKFEHDVVVMYKNGTPIAAISDEGFDLDPSSYDSLPGITTILPGIVLNPAIPNSPKFVGVASSAIVSDSTENFSGTLGLNNIPPIFLTNFEGSFEGLNAINVTTGTLTIANNSGLSVGVNADVGIRADSSTGYIVQNIGGNNLQIQGRDSEGTYFSGFSIISNPERKVGILNDNPEYTVDIEGDTAIRGNLRVFGDTVYITSNDLRVNDKTIELNYSDDPVDDSIASGGGIILNGDTQHTLTWTTNFGGSWQSNNNFNLSDTTSTYKIGGQDVLSQTALESGVTTAAGLTRIGTLEYLTITNILITGTTISTLGINQELILAPSNNAPINVTLHKITNLSTCTNALDAANKEYVDNIIFQTKFRFSFTIDETNIPDPTDIIPYLNKIFPIVNVPPYDPFNIPNGSVARVLCGTSVYTMPETAVDPTNKTFVTINGISVLQDVNFKVPETNITVTTTYVVREFLVQNGEWTYVGVI